MSIGVSAGAPAAAAEGRLPSSSAQRRRWLRIVDAARMVAAAGGYEQVNMRIVADNAEVSTATLYRYFPSKQHLLVTALAQWLEQFDCHLVGGAEPDHDPFQRLDLVVGALFSSLYCNPSLAEAMARAYATADATAARQVEGVRVHLSEIFAEALGGGAITDLGLEIGALLSDLWATNVLAISHGRTTAAEVRQRMSTTIRLLAKQFGSAFG